MRECVDINKSNELAANGFGVALEKPQNNWVRVGHKISTGSCLMCSIKEYIGSARKLLEQVS
jgi:hypothetical protein